MNMKKKEAAGQVEMELVATVPEVGPGARN